MKKYKFNINGNSYHIDIKEADNNIIKLEVNGSPYEVELDVAVKTSKTPTLIRTEPPPVQKVEPLASGTSTKKIVAPLPGVILKVLVKEGDVVKTGDALVILEAMKMENTILAESSGRIQSVRIQPSNSVLQGDLLVEII